MKMEFVRHNIVQLAETYDVKPELYNTIIFSKVSYKITWNTARFNDLAERCLRVHVGEESLLVQTGLL